MSEDLVETTQPVTTEPVVVEPVAETTTEILPYGSTTGDLVVLARNPEEMRKAQQGLIAWFEEKLAAERAQLAECEENHRLAKQMKVRTGGWARQVSLAKGRVTFYEKGLAALQEGYCIVPDFPVQLIAVRTSKALPSNKTHTWSQPDQVSDSSLKAGEGRYVSPQTANYAWKGEDQKTHVRAVSFRDVDFPFKLVKPQILSDLDAALKAKIFDEIGILPTVRTNKPDPVLIGRVRRRTSQFREVVLSFLITWWIDTRTL